MNTKIVFILLAMISGIVPLTAQQRDTQTKEFVFLLHGLGRGRSIMEPLQERLQKAGFETQIIGYQSLRRTPDEILHDATRQIDSLLPKKKQIVHFVGHSLGGLVIRAYLDSHRIQNLGNVVLIGSPNKGTPFVDRFRDSWWLKLAGTVATSLGTDEKSFPRTLRPPYYPVGVIAGITTTFNNEDFIPGEDDGIVPVESTKVDGMTDFILLQVSHSSLPRNEEVANQTIEFLRNKKFLNMTKQ